MKKYPRKEEYEGPEWNDCFEDVPLIWNEDNGWRMMSDEEFAEFEQK